MHGERGLSFGLLEIALFHPGVSLELSFSWLERERSTSEKRCCATCGWKPEGSWRRQLACDFASSPDLSASASVRHLEAGCRRVMWSLHLQLADRSGHLGKRRLNQQDSCVAYPIFQLVALKWARQKERRNTDNHCDREVRSSTRCNRTPPAERIGHWSECR
jgi:hypothetical protein